MDHRFTTDNALRDPCRHALVVFGTRPEAIKLAPVIEALRAAPGIRVTVCSTGQHRDLLDTTLADLEITPDVDLGLMKPGQGLSKLFGAAIAAVDDVVATHQPDTVIVQGDTTTVAAASLAAFHAGARVAHVEAGLRTQQKRSPFPEEVNRRVAGVVADWHFAPTLQAEAALRAENVDPGSILVTGNTGIDSVLAMAERLEHAEIPAEVDSDGRSIVLVTAHRRENFGQPYEDICTGVLDLAAAYPDHLFLWPLHLNPNARDTAKRRLSGVDNIRLTEPFGYRAMVSAMSRAALILTDSGGVQEEAPSLGVPVLVLRESTERPEAVRSGAATLVGTDVQRIVEESVSILSKSHAPRNPVMVYGDGSASDRIVRRLANPAAVVEPFAPPVSV